MMISHFLTGLTICTDKHSNIIQLTHNSVPQLIFLDIRNFTSCHQTIFRFVVSRDDDSTYLCHIIIVWAQILDIIISLLVGQQSSHHPQANLGQWYHQLVIRFLNVHFEITANGHLLSCLSPPHNFSTTQ